MWLSVVLSQIYIYGGRESSTHCNFRNNMQIEKAPANQENISLTTHTQQMLTTQPNKEMYSNCSQRNQINNCICSALIFLVALWAFAVHFFIWLCLEHVLSNWLIWHNFIFSCVFKNTFEIIPTHVWSSESDYNSLREHAWLLINRQCIWWFIPKKKYIYIYIYIYICSTGSSSHLND